MEKDKVPKIVEKLNIKNVTRDMTHNDPKIQIRAVFQAWIPLSSIILLQCLKIVPSPCQMDKMKIEQLLNLQRVCEDQYLSKCIETLIPCFEKISIEPTTPTIAYVSKMFCVNKKNLSQNKPKAFIPKPRDKTQQENPTLLPVKGDQEKQNVEIEETEKTYIDADNVIMALARVFSGTLKIGQEIYILSSSYLPDKKQIENNPDDFVKMNRFVSKVEIKELYMLFGRELMLVDWIPAGNFCGIGGLENDVIRTATLSSILNIVPINEKLPSNPIVRNSIEPVNPQELPILHQGLKLLMQSDSCVDVLMEKTGELVILTAGDVHLGKCIEDLRTKFAQIEFHVSRPMVSLRETIVNRSDFDFNKDSFHVVLETNQFIMSTIAVSMPDNIYEAVKNNADFLTIIEQHEYKSFVDIAKQFGQSVKKPVREKDFKSEITKRGISHVKDVLKTAFESNGVFWTGFQDKIWSISKKTDCINLLINNVTDYTRSIFIELGGYDKRALFDHCFIKAYNTLCEAGPICEEPLRNCVFFVNKFEFKVDVQPEDITQQTTASVESSIRDSFRRAFEKQEQRLMEPMYMTEIQVNTNILGEWIY
ncbi:hypothetical protein NQ317_019222 [Molorchus minor]|uniref:Elongation factor 2 n=1 Tax=Molorchus minor TaxID=1323400 RepID=A0ABQ9JS48_9CUCU|nr:hypothetical protein NQ317_019222 [Molorchus minor]